MKLSWVGLLCGLILSGCGKSEEKQLADELIPVISRAADDIILQTEVLYRRCNQHEEKTNFDQIGFMKEAGIEKCKLAHQIAKRFLNYSSQFREEHRYHEHYPFDEMNSRFQTTFDSLASLVQFMPENKPASFEYSQSRHKSNLILTSIRMDYDIATLEVEILKILNQEYWVTVFRDDFGQSTEK